MPKMTDVIGETQSSSQIQKPIDSGVATSISSGLKLFASTASDIAKDAQEAKEQQAAFDALGQINVAREEARQLRAQGKGSLADLRLNTFVSQIAQTPSGAAALSLEKKLFGKSTGQDVREREAAEIQRQEAFKKGLTESAVNAGLGAVFNPDGTPDYDATTRLISTNTEAMEYISASPEQRRVILARKPIEFGASVAINSFKNALVTVNKNNTPETRRKALEEYTMNQAAERAVVFTRASQNPDTLDQVMSVYDKQVAANKEVLNEMADWDARQVEIVLAQFENNFGVAAGQDMLYMFKNKLLPEDFMNVVTTSNPDYQKRLEQGLSAAQINVTNTADLVKTVRDKQPITAESVGANVSNLARTLSAKGALTREQSKIFENSLSGLADFATKSNDFTTMQGFLRKHITPATIDKLKEAQRYDPQAVAEVGRQIVRVQSKVLADAYDQLQTFNAGRGPVGEFFLGSRIAQVELSPVTGEYFVRQTGIATTPFGGEQGRGAPIAAEDREQLEEAQAIADRLNNALSTAVEIERLSATPSSRIDIIRNNDPIIREEILKQRDRQILARQQVEEGSAAPTATDDLSDIGTNPGGFSGTSDEIERGAFTPEGTPLEDDPVLVKFIKKVEGENRFDVPSNNSGATVGFGLDLGQRTLQEVSRIAEQAGVSQQAKSIMEQLAGLTGEEARQRVKDLKIPKKVSEELLKNEELRRLVFRDNIEKVTRDLKTLTGVDFATLPRDKQILLFDMSFNPGLTKFPKFTKAVIAGDRKQAIKESKRFADNRELGRNKDFKALIEKLLPEDR